MYFTHTDKQQECCGIGSVTQLVHVHHFTSTCALYIYVHVHVLRCNFAGGAGLQVLPANQVAIHDP